MVACRMSDTFNRIDHHTPVLLNEAINSLINSRDGIYVDATFGRGNHSSAILNQLNQNGRVIAIDRDPAAIQYGKDHFKDPRLTLVHNAFANLQHVLQDLQVFGSISGILFDLGISSPQLENSDRGFSFSRDGQLDMRMDITQGIDAASWLAAVDEKELADVLWQYGEERFSRRIARAIVEKRQQTPITTTGQLVQIILQNVPRSKKTYDKHPATRTFQAIRIAVNNELQELQLSLPQALDALKIGGRLCVISFHSLEDRIVKQFLKQHSQGLELPRGLPIKAVHFKPRIQIIGKPIKPSLQEINTNPRARSAILRIAEKLS
jgi:16S rRNA (cytosine1402-N4)-methyltransferase